MKPIRGGLLSALGAALLLLALSPATSWAAYPGANGRIAYYAYELETSTPPPEDSEIFTIPPAGGDPTQLTDNSVHDLQPSWSADGRRIAFRRWDGHDWEVWTMRSDGTHQRRVTDDQGHEGPPSFSPSGGRIIMSYNHLSSSDGNNLSSSDGNIVTVRTDGTDWVRLLYSGRRSADPKYSPGGRRIVFAGAASKTGKRGIWVMRRDGSHRQLLTNGQFGQYDLEQHPDFSPDGLRIVYHRRIWTEPHGEDQDIVIMRGGRLRRVIDGYHDPAFSPDGTRIAVVRTNTCDSDPCSSDIFTIARDGSDEQQVSPILGGLPFSEGPAWQPIPQP